MSCSRTHHGDACGDRTLYVLLKIRLYALSRDNISVPSDQISRRQVISCVQARSMSKTGFKFRDSPGVYLSYFFNEFNEIGNSSDSQCVIDPV